MNGIQINIPGMACKQIARFSRNIQDHDLNFQDESGSIYRAAADMTTKRPYHVSPKAEANTDHWTMASLSAPVGRATALVVKRLSMDQPVLVNQVLLCPARPSLRPGGSDEV